jgi:hypothetical protein
MIRTVNNVHRYSKITRKYWQIFKLKKKKKNHRPTNDCSDGLLVIREARDLRTVSPIPIKVQQTFRFVLNIVHYNDVITTRLFRKLFRALDSISYFQNQ